MKILQFPLVPFVFSFVLGLLLAGYLTASLNLQVLFIVLFVVVFLIGTSILTRRNGIILGLLIHTAGVCLGLTTVVLSNPLRMNHHYFRLTQHSSPSIAAHLQVKERLKATAKNYRYEADVTQWNGVPATGKILLNISTTQAPLKLKYGDCIKVVGRFYTSNQPRNPFQFDYGDYLAKKGIYGQLYTQNDQVTPLGFQNSLSGFFSNYREALSHRLEATAIDRQVLSIFAALLLGQQQDIDREIIQEYQYAGAIHILSVSGLHVGLILLFIQGLLRPFGNSQKIKTIKLGVIIFSLLGFAMTAGMAPSIVRAVTMFVFLAIGMYLKRSVNIYHTLLVSAFLILLFKPSYLYDIGFQLSYLALFFIVWFQPVLKKIVQPQHTITSYFWDIITVSIAAQVGTLPLSIYYFHQFPGLFLLTNCLVLPYLGLVMALGTVVLAATIFNFIPSLLILILEKSLVFLNDMIHWVASFENFVVQDIPFSKPLLLVSYMVLILWILWLKKPHFKTIHYPLIGIITLQSVYLLQISKINTSAEGIIFCEMKQTLISERIGKSIVVYTHKKNANAARDNQAIKAYAMGNFSTIEKVQPFQNFLQIHHQKLLIVDRPIDWKWDEQPDIVLLVNSPKINLERLLLQLQPKVIVADASNFKKQCQLWEATCLQKNIPFHAVYEKGYFRF